MKNRIFLLFLAFVFFACTEKKETMFVLNGTIDGMSGGIVRMQLQDTNGEFYTGDSAKLINGQFSFSGDLEYPEIVYLYFGEENNKYMYFYLENSEISITAHIDSLRNAKITGSKSNDLYNTYLEGLSTFVSERRQLSLSLREAREAKNEALVSELQAGIQKSLSDMQDYQIKFISDYNNSVVAANLTYVLSTRIEDFNLLDSLYNNFLPGISESKYYNRLKDRVEALRKVSIGQAAPDFTLNDTTGNPVTMSSLLKGNNYLFIDFWASWCAPCRAENPNVVDMYKKYHSKGFDILSVSFDREGEKDKWIQAIKDDNLNWNHVSDLKYWDCEAGKLYVIKSIPASVLIDGKGVIIAKNLRGEELQNKLKELFEN